MTYVLCMRTNPLAVCLAGQTGSANGYRAITRINKNISDNHHYRFFQGEEIAPITTREKPIGYVPSSSSLPNMKSDITSLLLGESVG